MKKQSLLFVLFLTLGISSWARAQCCMTGSGSHKHDEKKAESHGDHTAGVTSKGFAFINDDGMQETSIIIIGGYKPDTIVVKKGIPLRVNFDLKEKSCTGTVVFKDFNIKKELTPFQITRVEFTPDRSGSFTFACPMGMIQGTLVVKE